MELFIYTFILLTLPSYLRTHPGS